MYQPLADALRPQELSDVCGQQHILGENGLLRRIIESGAVPNMIFYGPSGTGKTTVANLIAKKTQRKLCKLNATTASSADIKEIYAQLDTFLAPNGVLLYLDEIQYFNKKQQQTLLEYIENGKITLIASTTENPYFYVYNAILSRSTVFEFKPVEKDEAQRAVSRALNYLEARDSVTILPEPGVKEHIAQSCGGDIRKALNAVEFLYTATRPENGVVRLTMADAKQVSQRSAMRYDKSIKCIIMFPYNLYQHAPVFRHYIGAVQIKGLHGCNLTNLLHLRDIRYQFFRRDLRSQTIFCFFDAIVPPVATNKIFFIVFHSLFLYNHHYKQFP